MRSYLFPATRIERAAFIRKQRDTLRRLTAQRVANGGQYQTRRAMLAYWKAEDRIRAARATRS